MTGPLLDEFKTFAVTRLSQQLAEAQATIEELQRRLNGERERIAKHFDATHRELWTPAIADEIRNLPIGE